jgi:hypothetical protein
MSEVSFKRDQLWPSGELCVREYFMNDVLHREDEPAYMSFNRDGSKYYEEYYKNGSAHREDGPACIMYHEDGTIQELLYAIQGNYFSVEEFRVFLLLITNFTALEKTYG